VSLTKPGQVQRYDNPARGSAPLLPTGHKIAAAGVVCAIPADDTLACRARKPDTWGTDTPDPPGEHYGEHGFVVQPSGSLTY
jgi:hypothetical protein